MPASAARPVLYVVACGSPVARYVGRLIAPAQQAGWQVWVIATPDGRKFLDLPELSEQTGHPVRSEFRNPGDPDLLPSADAIVVAPATVNTVNKWACGIADTLALGLLIEGYGLGVPMVAMPYTNTAMAAHPAFLESLRRLRTWGVRVLFGEEVVALPRPGRGSHGSGQFPWQLALSALGPARRLTPSDQLECPTRPDRPAALRPDRPAGLRPDRAETPRPDRVRLAPPAAPRPAPAILRGLLDRGVSGRGSSSRGTSRRGVSGGR